jgi:hypothetical protein
MGRWLAVATFALAGCSVSATRSPDDFPADPLDRVQSRGGAVIFEVRTAPTQPPSRGATSVEYRITDEHDRPIDGLNVEVVAWMPEMAHGASARPQVVAEGDGRYVVDEVDLYMPGRWELRTSFFAGGAIDDDAVVSLQIP